MHLLMVLPEFSSLTFLFHSSSFSVQSMFLVHCSFDRVSVQWKISASGEVFDRNVFIHCFVDSFFEFILVFLNSSIARVRTKVFFFKLFNVHFVTFIVCFSKFVNFSRLI